MLGKREKEHKWKHIREDVLHEEHLESSGRVVLEVNFHVLRSIDIENALSEGQWKVLRHISKVRLIETGKQIRVLPSSSRN